MFTESELKAIAKAHKEVYEAIRPNFGHMHSDSNKDARARTAGRIVAAKIIANQVEAVSH